MFCLYVYDIIVYTELIIKQDMLKYTFSIRIRERHKADYQ